MAESTIITPNVPNAVSITVMAVVGGFLLSLVTKAWRNRQSAAGNG